VSDKTVKVRLEAVTTQYTAAMGRAGQSTATFTKGIGASTGKAARGLQEIQTEATVAGAALLGMGVAAVASFTTFDKQMSAVKASTKASTAEIDKLRESALQAGADTKYSATEAAQGQEALAKAGISTANILRGGLAGALDLAAAGEIAVADAADIAATALTVFELKGSDVSHVADLLAAGAGKAQGSVDDMGMALKQSALVAKQTGLSIEDTTGALAQFASAGLLGSDAGTSFKTMLQRLTPQSDEAADLMNQLGLNAYDASGQFIGLEAYAGKLRDGLSRLTPEARNAALATLFGSDAVRAAAVLYEGGAEGVRKWREAVDDSGFAAAQAAILMDNLAGDVEQLGGSVETALIKQGSTANGILRTTVQIATDVVNTFSQLPAPIQATGLAVTAAAGAFLLLAPRAVQSYDAFQRIEAAAPRTGRALRTVGKAAGIATAALIALELAGEGFDAISDQAVNAGRGTNELVRDLKRAGTDLKALGLGFQTEAGNAMDFNEALSTVAANSWVDTLGSTIAPISTTFDLAKESVAGLDDALAAMVNSGDLEGAAATFQDLRDSFVASGGSASDFERILPAYRDALAGVDLAAEGAAGSHSDVAGAIADADAAAQSAEDALAALESALADLRGESQTADQATSELEAAFDDAAEAAKDMTGAVTKGGKGLDLTTEAGRKAQSALGDITDALFDALPAWKANGDSAKTVQDRVETARVAFIKQAIQMGLTRDAAKDLADEYGLIPSKILTEYTTPGADAARKAAEAVTTALGKIPRRVPVSIVVTRTGAITTGQGQSSKPAVASGGFVYGSGTATSDSIDARLSNGEHVTRAAVAQAHKPLMAAINDGRLVDAQAYLSTRVGGAGGSNVTYVTNVTAAPGERAEESVPRAHQKQAFLAGWGG